MATKKVFGNYIDEFDGIDDSNMRPLLRKIFEPAQLTLIESAFEKEFITDNGEGADEYGKEVTKALRFGSKYKSDHNRLIAIMKNIIKNKGEFKP